MTNFKNTLTNLNEETLRQLFADAIRQGQPRITAFSQEEQMLITDIARVSGNLTKLSKEKNLSRKVIAGQVHRFKAKTGLDLTNYSDLTVALSMIA